MAKRARQGSLFETEEKPTAVPAPPPAEEDEACEGPEPGESVWIIDVPSRMFQLHFGIKREMSTPEGTPIKVVHSFTRDLFRFYREKKPDFLFCAFDLDGPTFRETLYPEYKAHREDMPDDLSQQVPILRELLEKLRIPVLETPGFEADDVLATIARRTAECGAKCVLVTSDKDCRQLLREEVIIFNSRTSQFYDPDDLLKDWGIRPDQVVDFQALVGDSVDNVPGVPLIGPKYAQQLLSEYDTLDAVLDSTEQMKPSKRRDNLVEYREQALVSRQLVRLSDEVPLEVDWQKAKPGYFNRAEVEAFFKQLNFRTAITELYELELPGLTDDASALTSEDQEPQILLDTVAWEHDYTAVTTKQALTELIQQLQQQPWFSFDLETTSLKGRQAKIVGFSFAWQPSQAFYVPVQVPEGEPQLDLQETLAALKPLLENPHIGKVGQNLKFEWVVLQEAGVQLRGIQFDTLVGSYLLDPGGRNHNLDALSERYLAHRTVKIEELIGSGKKQKTMDQVPLSEITYYAAEDADVPLRLRPILETQLEDQQLRQLYDELELPLVEVLAKMEYQGIFVDIPRLEELSQQYAVEMSRLEQEIFELAGHDFNINSPKQLQVVLFEELKLPVKKKLRTGASTDVDVLAELSVLHPLPARLIEYRQYAKLKGTYIDALPLLVNPKTRRVHASFNQHITATGRLSSSDPNLQNIPIRTEQGREIRSAFRADPPDWQLLCADYSQIELRFLAHFTGDAALRQAFQDDQDIHALVASQVNQVPLEAVTKDMRREAKTVNFGIIYGQTPYGLARQLGIDRKSAEQFIETYLAQYPGVQEFLEETLAFAREHRYVTTIMGRRRAIDGVRKRVSSQLNFGERTAINTVIQGSAADLIKQAMLAVTRRLAESNLQGRLLLQIHDELVFESPTEEIDALAELVVSEMTNVLQLDVPLKVDASCGQNWLETQPIG